jgi:hypothetical protein
MKYLPILTLLTSLLYSQETIQALPSLQGFRGVVNTPNAEVQQEGEFELLYTNQVENLTPDSVMDFRDDKREENYFLNMGVLPNLDATLRYSYGENLERDISYLSDRIINLKYQLPFIPKDILTVALGAEDLGGGNSYLSSQYMVLSKTYKNLRASLGYAKGEEIAALDGVFGSIEYQPFAWLQLGGEYDTKEWNGILKANYATTLYHQPTNIGLMAKSSLDYNDLYFGIYANSQFDQRLGRAWERSYLSMDHLKPTLMLEPSFILVDGSEYGHMDYTVALNAELSMRLFDHTIVSGEYNIPLSMSGNFDDGGIFAYRNRHKTTPNIDQILLSQYLPIKTSYPWINLLQVGRFDKELEGVSFESGVSNPTGEHRVMLKLSYLQDDLHQQMDRYRDEIREEKLLSYQYHLAEMNANLKLTAGEFLYNDRGVMLGLKRYFKHISASFDIAYTKHDYKGNNKVGRLTLTMPFGTTQKLRSDYLDLQMGDLTYVRRKTLALKSGTNYAQPLHLNEVKNHFTLENYYLEREHF